MTETDKKPKTPKSDKPTKEDLSGNGFITQMFLLGIAVITLPIVAYILKIGWGDGVKLSSNPADWALFGDFYGGIANPTIALLALMALLYAIQLQREEFKKMQEGITSQLMLDSFSKMMDRVMKDIDVILETNVRKPDEIPLTLSKFHKNVVITLDDFVAEQQFSGREKQRLYTLLDKLEIELRHLLSALEQCVDDETLSGSPLFSYCTNVVVKTSNLLKLFNRPEYEDLASKIRDVIEKREPKK